MNQFYFVNLKTLFSQTNCPYRRCWCSKSVHRGNHKRHGKVSNIMVYEWTRIKDVRRDVLGENSDKETIVILWCFPGSTRCRSSLLFQTRPAWPNVQRRRSRLQLHHIHNMKVSFCWHFNMKVSFFVDIWRRVELYRRTPTLMVGHCLRQAPPSRTSTGLER